MAVRFKRVGISSGGGVIDHNDLLNKGVRTHAEIDSYLDEIDKARGSFIDLDARIGTGGTGGGGTITVDQDVTFEKDTAGNVTAEIYTDVSVVGAPVILKRVDYVYGADGVVQTETETNGTDVFRKTYFFEADGSIQKIEVRRV